jgi:hypothetical protein
LAYPRAAMKMHEDLTKDQFVEALGDGEIRWSVFQARPKNLTEALKVALELEAFKESEKCRVRRSVRGIRVEAELPSKQGVEQGKEGLQEDMGRIEVSLQQAMSQIAELRQVSRGDVANRNAGMRSQGEGKTEGPGGAAPRVGTEGGGIKDGNTGGREGYGQSRPPFDMGRIRCYRCDKTGHYVRDCPELPRGALRGDSNKKVDLKD